MLRCIGNLNFTFFSRHFYKGVTGLGTTAQEATALRRELAEAHARLAAKDAELEDEQRALTASEGALTTTKSPPSPAARCSRRPWCCAYCVRYDRVRGLFR